MSRFLTIFAAGAILLLTSPVFADNCLCPVYHDPTGDPLDDSDLHIVCTTWEDAETAFDEFDVLAVRLLIDNPVGNEGEIQHTGHEIIGWTFHPGHGSVPRDGITIAERDFSPVFGRRLTYRESLSTTDPATLSTRVFSTATVATAMNSANVVGVVFDFNDPDFDDNVTRALAVTLPGCAP